MEMEVVYIEFTRCEIIGTWDYTESDVKTYYEVKSEPAILDIWTRGGKKESYKFKKGAIIRITSNTIRFNKEHTK
jgi:hypothetical protein